MGSWYLSSRYGSRQLPEGPSSPALGLGWVPGGNPARKTRIRRACLTIGPARSQLAPASGGSRGPMCFPAGPFLSGWPDCVSTACAQGPPHAAGALARKLGRVWGREAGRAGAVWAAPPSVSLRTSTGLGVRLPHSVPQGDLDQRFSSRFICMEGRGEVGMSQ